jgi:hypothetical protein
MIKVTIIEGLKHSFTQAYEAMYKEMLSIGRTDKGVACLPEDDVIHKQMLVISGRCGARCGAAVKKAKRRLVFETLLALNNTHFDLTVTNVQHLTKRVLGRGFDNVKVVKVFGTPGRTAAHRSKTNSETLMEVEQDLDAQLAYFLHEVSLMKREQKKAWLHSKERKAVLDDWSKQKTNLLKG